MEMEKLTLENLKHKGADLPQTAGSGEQQEKSSKGGNTVCPFLNPSGHMEKGKDVKGTRKGTCRKNVTKEKGLIEEHGDTGKAFWR